MMNRRQLQYPMAMSQMYGSPPSNYNGALFPGGNANPQESPPDSNTGALYSPNTQPTPQQHPLTHDYPFTAEQEGMFQEYL